jgi:teichuronic acid biosynthesis glycosyltransferase TuaH
VARTAERLGTAGTVVLVGPIPLAATSRRLLDDAGVLALGPRPSAEVPAYLTNADLLLVPHVITSFTESLDPIKAYEYRAARRPVLTTAVRGFRDVTDPMVRVVDDVDFPDEVRAILTTTRAEGRGSIPVTVPTWDQRVAQMAEVIEAVQGARS